MKTHVRRLAVLLALSAVSVVGLAGTAAATGPDCIYLNSKQIICYDILD